VKRKQAHNASSSFMVQSPSEAIAAQLDKAFSAFYRAWRFITVFTTAPYWGVHLEPCVSSPYIQSYFCKFIL